MMPGGVSLHELMLLVGRIDGKLDLHMASVERDRNAAAASALESAEYRKEVRHKLNNLSMGVAAVPPLAERVEAVEGTADDWKKFKFKLAGAIFVCGSLIAAIVQIFMFFAPQLKALFLHLLGFPNV